MCESEPSIIDDNLTFYALCFSSRILKEGSMPFVSSPEEAQSAYQLNENVFDFTFAEHPLPPKIYSDGAIINESLN